MEFFIKIILNVLLDKFFELGMSIFKDLALKRGINLKAKKSLEAIKLGDSYLHQGNLQGWLDQLNKEQT